MGELVDGKWLDEDQLNRADGKFVRKPSQFRGAIGDAGYPAESGRYQLFVSHACPWAHRAVIFRVLKRLEDHIGLTVVSPFMLENGWEFGGTEDPKGDKDPFGNFAYLHQYYTKAQSDYTGRVTVPLLWDTKTETAVNNESSEIIRMFNSAFETDTPDYYPEGLRGEIDEINDYVYSRINNGVYKAGFATTQEAYNEAVLALFEALDAIDARLGKHRYLVGDTLTEADWRLFTTLLRFDPVYVSHFKCNLRRIADYPNLSGYLHDLYQHDGVAATVDMAHIKTHYFASHKKINPTGIIPMGPDLDLTKPHGRG